MNLFVPNAIFLYSLERVGKGRIYNKWVKGTTKLAVLMLLESSVLTPFELVNFFKHIEQVKSF